MLVSDWVRGLELRESQSHILRLKPYPKAHGPSNLKKIENPGS